MSASPAGGTPGGTPNGTPRPPMPRRQQKPVDPLMRPKPRRRQLQRPTHTNNLSSKESVRPTGDSKPTGQTQTAGGAKSALDPKYSNNVQMDAMNQSSRPRDRARFQGATELARPEPQLNTGTMSLIDAVTGEKASGFSTAAPGTYTDYPVFISKQDLMAGLRPHVARFASKQAVDPSDQKEWVRPVRLHRRDPRAPPPGGKPEELSGKDAEIEEERQKQELLRTEREAQRAAAMAEVAPSVHNPNARRNVPGKKKITQVFAKDETEEQRAKSQLKYEEALPWHFEDFDNRQTWVGSYEAALSNTYASLIFKDGKFHIAPVEKWYKFTQKRVFKTQEELEAAEAKRELHQPKWLANYELDQEAKKAEEQNKRATSKLFDMTSGRRAAGPIRGSSAKDREDANELDFEEDMADDEEDPLLEGDVEEAKETAKRIKKDQLQANIFNTKDEESYEKAELMEKFEKRARKDEGKGIRKVLTNKERQLMYDLSDSSNPLSEKSDSEKSDGERKEDQNKAEVDEKKKSTQPGSGASTKGTNTPSGRKKLEAQRNASSNSLKRAGSPNLSEASGNESSRKKLKKKHGTSSNLGSGINTPNGPVSRPISPALGSDSNVNRANATGTQKKPTAPRGGEVKRLRPGGAGSGSEGDGAGSGGDMSDGSRKKIKLKSSVPGSKNVSPDGSRAASPSRDAAPTTAAKTGTAPSNPGPPPKIPSLDELKQMVPDTGVKFATFISKFKSVGTHPETRAKFMSLVKTHFKMFNNDGVKMLRPVKAADSKT